VYHKDEETPYITVKTLEECSEAIRRGAKPPMAKFDDDGNILRVDYD